MAGMSYISLSLALVLVGIVSIGAVAVSRLYFHRLKDIPGPKLAAITSAYEFYYDCIKGGQYYFEIFAMHQKYGPIVRVGPNEVHINDPTFFDKLYNVVGKFDKDPWYYRFLDQSEAAFGTENAELHRIRRKPMAKFFSPAFYSRLEQPIQANVAKLAKRCVEFRDTKKPLNLSNALRCLATDNVTDYCLPHGFNMLDEDDFANDYNKQARSFASLAQWHRHIPIIIPLFMMLPRWFIKLTAPPGSLESFDFQTSIVKQAHGIATSEKRSDETVVHGIMNSTELPESQKYPSRVVEDARTLVGAGAETVATTMEATIFYVLSDPTVRKRLEDELATVVEPDKAATYNSLRKLPYLSAVINEGLRIESSVCGRMPRIDPRNDILYKGYVLPAGTSISMSIPDNHWNAEIYPEPRKFDPERWLRPGEKERAEQYLVAFGRGSRICLGKDFAIVTLYVTMANILGKFDLELYQTTQRDIDMAHDYFAPFPVADSKGIQVMVK